MRRVVPIVLALAVVVAAGVWVSAVRFEDEAGATDCGVPLGSATGLLGVVVLSRKRWRGEAQQSAAPG